jgi:hypothetical protein
MKPADVIPADLPLSMELHQTGEDTDICFRSNYWHLQLWYIKQEMHRSMSIRRSAVDTFFAEWRK